MRGLLALLVFALAAPAAAQEISIELAAPADLREGDRAQITARVRGAGTHPLLLTPASEGTALEVVRGRLLRADAIDPRAEVLEFRIPIVANAPGTAVVRVSAAGYTCAARCRLVRADASLAVRVGPALTGSRKQEDLEEEASRQRSSSLSWVRMPGAESCASSAALAQAIEERLAREVFVSAANADLAVEGRAEREGTTWRAVIMVSDADGTMLGERTLTSDRESCDDLLRVVAVAVALMIDPLTAPPPEEEREPEVVVREVVREVPVEVPVPAPPAPGWRVEIDSAIAGTIGLLPTGALGGVTTIIVEPPGFIPLALEGAIVPWARADDGAGGYADFLHVHAGLMICPLGIRERGLALHGCVGADAGAVVVLGGTIDVEENERLIGQAHAVLRGHWDVVGVLTIRLAVHLLIPFRHEPFLYGGGTQRLYAPEPVAGMLDLGAGLHFD